MMEMRTRNSHKTAIRRNKLSAPMRQLSENGHLRGRMLDYGCGLGDDARILGVDAYDPYHRPEWPRGKYDTITCIYVLNALETEAERQETLERIDGLLNDTGVAFIAIRRDVAEKGWSQRDTFQENAELDLPVLYRRGGSYVIYAMRKDRNTK